LGTEQLGTSILRHYAGDRCSEHLGNAGRPHTLARYASDTTQTKRYEFNPLGFRGEGLDPAASFRLFVCGPSYAFGTGLNWEETWGYQLKLELARHQGIAAESVNLLNFSQSLASASFITRTLIGQCERVRPDLVVAHFSFCARTEIFLDQRTATITPARYPWHRRLRALRPGWKQRLARLFPGLRSIAEADLRLQAMHHYYGLYTEELGVANTLTQILLLQAYCRSRGIACLISWNEHWLLASPRFLENPDLAPLIDLIDRHGFCPFSIADKEIQVDFGADGIHPGPRSSRAFAELLMARYEQLRPEQQHP
jgi:hypothetical protein